MITQLPSFDRPGRGSPRRRASLVLAGVLVVALVGCSDSDGDGDGGAPVQATTTIDAAVATSTTATEATVTTGTTGTGTGDPVTPGGPTRYVGTLDGQDTGVEVTFTRDGAITDFEVSGLAIECLPLGSGDPSTRPATVAIPEAPVSADGRVEHIEEGAPYEPSLTGSFTEDGSFAGGLFLSGEDDGFVCGGEFTFLAGPA